MPNKPEKVYNTVRQFHFPQPFPIHILVMIVLFIEENIITFGSREFTRARAPQEGLSFPLMVIGIGVLMISLMISAGNILLIMPMSQPPLVLTITPTFKSS